MKLCSHCGREDETTKQRESMTQYAWSGEGADPNDPGELCDECAEEYRAYWQERWDDAR